MSWRDAKTIAAGVTQYFEMTGADLELLLFRAAALHAFLGRNMDETVKHAPRTAIEFAAAMQQAAKEADGDD